MRLKDEIVSQGEWIVIEDAAPQGSDHSIQYVEFGTTRIAAYVDGRNLIFRCPDPKNSDVADIKVRGNVVGRVRFFK